ncbi:Acyl-CoA N-acyltransferase [Penicillium brevicompactum]
MITCRPATLADIPQVRDINHWYILNSCFTFTTTPPAVSHYEDLLRDLNRRQLPFYVVGSDTRQSDDGADLVLGYAYLSPWRGELLSYASTVELSIFMRADQRSFGYGTLLMQKILGFLQSGGVQHRCEERVGDVARIGAHSMLEVVNTSPVHNVIAIMTFDPENPAEGIRLRDWYNTLGFVHRGRLESVGKKMGRWLDTVYLQWSLPPTQTDTADGN